MEHLISIPRHKDESDECTLLRITPGEGDEDSYRQESNNTSSSRTKEVDHDDDESIEKLIFIFSLSCLAVSLDPLFLYIPNIDEKKKCIGMDKSLSVVLLILRLLTDIPFFIRIIQQIFFPIKKEKVQQIRTLTRTKKIVTIPDCWELHIPSELQWIYTKFINFAKGLNLAVRMPWLSFTFIAEFLAILPVPQVAVVVAFFRLTGSGYMYQRSIMNTLIVLQYLPRIGRIHLFRKKITRRIWQKRIKAFKGVFYFFLYILASYVLGAIWYFLAIQREAKCWHDACRRNSEKCSDSYHYCDDSSSSTTIDVYISYLNVECPINGDEPNTKRFDYGIYLHALKSGVTGHTDFSTKFFYTFWWGFRNMSNFGTNLETSTNMWENCFAILISVIGLLLFLYLIGNIGMYMQSAATEKLTLEEKQSADFAKEKLKLEEKKSADLEKENGRLRHKCLSRIHLPEYMNIKTMLNTKQNCEENIDADLFSIISPDMVRFTKQRVGMKALKNVPMLQHMDAEVFEIMWEYLRPVIYPEHSYIVQDGEQVKLMLIITEGIVWTWTPTSACAGKTASPLQIRGLEIGDLYGEELLVWSSLQNNSSSGDLPISTQTLKCQTEVHAYALSAEDLKSVASKCGSGWSFNSSNSNSRS